MEARESVWRTENVHRISRARITRILNLTRLLTDMQHTFHTGFTHTGLVQASTPRAGVRFHGSTAV